MLVAVQGRDTSVRGTISKGHFVQGVHIQEFSVGDTSFGDTSTLHRPEGQNKVLLYCNHHSKGIKCSHWSIELKCYLFPWNYSIYLDLLKVDGNEK
jgi:hypothetical protein